MKQIFTLAVLGLSLTASAASVADMAVRNLLPEGRLRQYAQSPMKSVGENMDLHHLPLIESLPDGMEAELYSRDSFFFARDGQGLMYDTSDFGRVSYIAVSESECYISDPFAGWPTGTWLKGERDGDKVTVSFPQMIYKETYPDWENDPYEELGLEITDYYYAYKFILREGEDKSSFVIDSDDPTITFTFDGTELREEGDWFIGMVGEYRMYDENEQPYTGYNWMGFADGRLAYSKVTADIVEVPENVEFEKWILDNMGDQTFVDIALKGDDVYVRGFIQTQLPGGELFFPAVKGKISGDKMTISGIQYLGIDPRFEHLAYAMPATYEEGTDEWAGENVYYHTDELVFDYDAEKKIFSAHEGQALVVSAIPDGIFTVMALDEPAFIWQDMSTPMTPQEPYDLKYLFFEDYGFGVVGFSLSAESTDGRMMDTQNLFYTIYLDGEEFTFYPDEYWDLDEPVTEMPYDYWDDSINSFGEEHEVLLYAMEIDKVGVQSIYKNLDGTVTKSAIATIATSGVKGMTGEYAQPVSEVWYDLAGRRVQSVGNGVFLKMVKYSDGTVKVNKVITK